MAPLATHVREHAGHLRIGHRRTERRHQARRAFLAVEQDAHGHVRCRKRERRPDEAGGASRLPPPVGLVAGLAHRLVDSCGPSSKRRCSAAVSGGGAASSPGLPGQVMRVSTAAACRPSGVSSAARRTKSSGGRARRRGGVALPGGCTRLPRRATRRRTRRRHSVGHPDRSGTSFQAPQAVVAAALAPARPGCRSRRRASGPRAATRAGLGLHRQGPLSERGRCRRHRPSPRATLRLRFSPGAEQRRGQHRDRVIRSWQGPPFERGLRR